MDVEWYIREYEEKTYLHNKELYFQHFPCEEGNHDHCELCWARFSKYSTDFKIGYYEPLSKSWLCPDCYNELKSLFQWTLAGQK